MSAERSSTIGQERRFNPALALATVEEFVADSACRRHAAAAEHGAHRRAQPRPVRRCSARRRAVARDGHFVLDVRDADAHAAGHVPGAVNVPVSGSSFGTKAAFLIPPGRTIALHADVAGAGRDGGQRSSTPSASCDLAGYLEDAAATETLEPMELDELERLVAGGSAST